MGYTLFIKADFLYSEYVPAVCLFSGRTEGLEKVGVPVRVPNPEAPGCVSPFAFLQIVALFAGIVIVRRGEEKEPLPIVATRGAYWRWKWARNGWIAGVVMLFIAPFLVMALAGTAQENPLAVRWQGGVALGVIGLTAAAWLAGRLSTPSIKMVGSRDVRLRWPAAMKATYDAYLDGYFEYSEEQELLRKRVTTERNKHLKYTIEESADDGPQWEEGGKPENAGEAQEGVAETEAGAATGEETDAAETDDPEADGPDGLEPGEADKD